MVLQNILSQEIVQKLGWTLLHFVWQAATVAFLLGILLALLRKSSANIRYIIACATMGLIVLLPIITIQMIHVSTQQLTVENEQSPKPVITAVRPATEETSPVIVVQYGKPSQPENTVVPPSIPWKQRVTERLEPALPYLVAGWLLGVFGLSLWHLGGWTQLQRLRKKLVKQVNTSINEKLLWLSEQLRVKQTVQLLESALAQVPTVVGWLRPVILLPASALTGLTAEQLEALLAHELAHVRRHDYLINMLQTVVETLGFYHPAVWWISHRIRVERENCCDDIAVSISGDRVRYARALTSMEEIRVGRSELAVAATGGNLFERIRRIVGKDSNDSSRASWIPSAITILLIAIISVPTTIALTTKSKSQEPQQKTEISDDAENKQSIRVDDFTLTTVGPVGSRALLFDGIDDRLFVPASPTLTLKPPFTIEMWIKPDFSEIERLKASGEKFTGLSLMRKGKKINDDGKIQAGGFAMFMQPPNIGNLYYGNTNGIMFQTGMYVGDGSALLAPPEWFHISVNCSREDYIPVPDEPLVIGEAIEPPFLPPFKGQIAEIRIWNRLFTRSDPSPYTDTALTGSEPNLVACWDFEHIKGQMVYDISPNHNHARLGSSLGADDADPKWRKQAETETDSNDATPGNKMRQINEAELDTVQKAKYTTLDPKTKRLEREFGFERLLHQAGNIWEIERPYMEVYGQKSTFYITANKGEVEVETAASRTIPKDITFSSNVVIHIVANRAGTIHENFLHLDKFVFHSDQSLVAIPGHGRFLSEDAQMRGIDLKATLDQADRNTNAPIESESSGEIRQGLMLAIVPNIDSSGHEPSLTKEEYQQYLDSLAQKGPLKESIPGSSFQWFPVKSDVARFKQLPLNIYKNQTYILLCTQARYVMVPRIEGRQVWGIENAWISKDSNGRPAIGIQFDEKGAELFYKLTKANIGNYLATVVDGQVLSAPRIETALRKFAMITGNFDPQESLHLVENLQKRMVVTTDTKNKIHQEQLNEILAKFSDGTTAGKSDSNSKIVRETVESYIAAALAGDSKKVTEYAYPGSAVAVQTSYIYQALQGQNIRIVGMCIDEWNSWAISSVIKIDQGTIGYIAFELKKLILEKKVLWLIEEIDLNAIDTIGEQIHYFFKVYPDAKMIIINPGLYTYTETAEQPDDRLQESIGSNQIVLNLVDPNSRPVVGAQVGTYVDFSDISENPPIWFLRSDRNLTTVNVKSDEHGKVYLEADEIFGSGQPAKEITPLTAIDEGHYLVGLREMSRNDLGKEVTLMLQPGCRVRGTVTAATARKHKWSTKILTVYVDWREHRPCQYSSKQGRFEFILPPGIYKIHVYSDDPDKTVILPILIKSGQRNLDLTKYLDATSKPPAGKSVTRVYDISDLVYIGERISRGAVDVMMDRSDALGASPVSIPDQAFVNEAQKIVNLITQKIDPNSWFQNNPNATGIITPYPVERPRKLAIYQILPVHQQIQKLLASRREQIPATQISIELRYLYTNTEFLDEVRDSMGIEFTSGTVLDDKQLGTLLRASQKKKDTRSLTAPGAMVLNNETVTFSIAGHIFMSFLGYSEPDNLSQQSPPAQIRITPHIEDNKNIIIDFLQDIPGLHEHIIHNRSGMRESYTEATSITSKRIPNNKTFAFTCDIIKFNPYRQRALSADKKTLIVLIKPTISVQEEMPRKEPSKNLTMPRIDPNNPKFKELEEQVNRYEEREREKNQTKNLSNTINLNPLSEEHHSKEAKEPPANNQLDRDDIKDEYTANKEYEVVQISYADVMEVAEHINKELQQILEKDLLESVLITPLEQTQQIIIFGRPDMREMVKRLIAEIDQQVDHSKKLSKLGKALLIYANDHDGKYPDSIAKVKQYLSADEFAWAQENVTYYGKGRTVDNLHEMRLARDNRQAVATKGTNILFSDGRIEFIKPGRKKILASDKGQIMFDIKILTTGDEFLKYIGFDPNSVASSKGWADYLIHSTDDSASFIVDQLHEKLLLRNVAARMRTHKDIQMFHVPKVLTLSGWKPEIHITDLTDSEHYVIHAKGGSPDSNAFSVESESESIEPGATIRMIPTLTPDGNNIELDFEWEYCRLQGFKKHTDTDGKTQKVPQIDIDSIKTSCTIPEGKTLLIAGKKIPVQKKKPEKPQLADLPLIGMLFINPPRPERIRNLIIMVTPTTDIKAPSTTQSLQPLHSLVDPNDPLINKLEEKFKRYDETKKD